MDRAWRKPREVVVCVLSRKRHDRRNQANQGVGVMVDDRLGPAPAEPVFVAVETILGDIEVASREPGEVLIDGLHSAVERKATEVVIDLRDQLIELTEHGGVSQLKPSIETACSAGSKSARLPSRNFKVLRSLRYESEVRLRISSETRMSSR